MTDTTFSARVTKITAAWAQALNDFLYKGRDATYVTSTGSTNAYKITLPSSLYSAYSEGDEFSFKAHAANTGASTLSIVGSSTLDAKNLYLGGAELSSGQIQIGDLVTVKYDGTRFHIVAGTPLNRFTQSGSGAIAQDLQARGRRIVFVTDFIPTNLHAGISAGSETTDVTTYIQAAIDAVNTAGGGVIYFPPGTYYCNGLVLKSGVVLWGVPRYKASSVTKVGARLRTASTGTIIDTPDGSSCDGAEINGLQIHGPADSAVAGKGIRFRDANGCAVKNCLIHGFADEGILVDSTSIACTFEDLHLTQCVLDRTRAAKTGAMDIDGTDHQFTRVESSTSSSIEATVSDSNLYVCAWVIRNQAMTFSHCIGQVSDVGFHLTSTGHRNKFVGCRADLNYGHGWEILGQRNMFAACHAYRNGQATNNTYDGFIISATTGLRNKFAACISDNLSSDTNKQRYGFNDGNSTNDPSQQSYYAACGGELNATALFNGSAFLGGTLTPPHVPIRATNEDATPTLSHCSLLILTQYTTDTTITDFDDPAGNQFLFVLGDANITIANNANIKTNTGANKRLRGNVIYIFQHYNGVWYELGADQTGTGTFTCANDDETVVSDTRVTASSIIQIQATNAAAATLMGGAKSLYISARTAGTSFTVTTADGNAAAGTETFNYTITEPV